MANLQVEYRSDATKLSRNGKWEDDGMLWRHHQRVLVGVDVQSISEVERSIREFGDHYLRRLYTDHERDSCQGDVRVAAGGLAARFAAKEAVIKLLDAGDDAPEWQSIEVRRTKSERPEVKLHGRAAEIARRRGVEDISLSLSHDGDVAVATVVAQSFRRRRSH
jgi:holo-[acyl-carrier protein] synthase